MKIRRKLIIIMIALNLVSVGIVASVLLTRSQSSIIPLVQKYTVSMARDSGGDVGKYLGTYWYTAETVAQIMYRHESIGVNNRRNFFNIMLEGLVEQNREIIGAWCVWEPDVLEGNDSRYIGTPGAGPDGRFSPYWQRSGEKVILDTLSGYDVPGEGDYYLLPKKSMSTMLLDPYVRAVGQEAILLTTVSSPILSQDGKLLGVVGMDISIEPIQEISQTRKPYADAVTAVFSNDGTIAAHFDTGRIGKNMRQTEQDMAQSHMDSFVHAIGAGKEYAFSNYIDALDENLELYAIPIMIGESKSPWSYAIGIMTKTVMEPVNTMMVITIVISVIMLAVVILASLFLARSISKPIVAVADTLKDISEGEGDLTQIIPEKGNDEISLMSHYFNKTLEKIKNLIISIKEQTDSLSDIGSELASNMSETAAAVNQITANVQSIKGRVLGQSASVAQTNSTMEQITLNIDKLNTHVEQQVSSVSQSSACIEQMLANIQSVTSTLVNNSVNVGELMEASEIGRTGLSEVAADIQEIARESEGLLQINAVMKNIASQTNLLSMNAAIEAAHAGEAGKGFAVVADEIRKLAESSGEQSKTIGGVLKKIKDSIDKITGSTENVLAKFEDIDSYVKIVAQQEEGIRSAMEEQGEGSKQVLECVGSVNETTQHVKSGSQEMLVGSKEVIQESKNLEAITQEITGGMNEMATGADQINIAVNRVNEISARNRENIDNLVQEVSKFKVA